MKPVLADTSFYGAIFNPRDAWHDAALTLSAKLRRHIVVTEFVLLELGNALSPVGSRRLFVDMFRHLRADRTVSIIPVSRSLYEKAFGLYSRRSDKDWSLTDCTSFVVMQQRRIQEALTADHHFEQAGFTILLK